MKSVGLTSFRGYSAKAIQINGAQHYLREIHVGSHGGFIRYV